MARRTRTEAPSLARTRSALPTVTALRDFAAPELSAWVAAHSEAVLRAAESLDAAYIAEVDALAPLLPGGEEAWQRTRASLTVYDSEREERYARKPVTLTDVEGWQSIAADPHGKKAVIALFPPVRPPTGAGFTSMLDNRWVYGFGTDRYWTLTTAWPSSAKPLELARYDLVRAGVATSQRAGKEGGGGSTMPALDAAHNALLQAFRIEARNPSRASQLDFGPMVVRGMMRRWNFPDDVMHAVVWKDIPGTSQPPRFHHPAQVKAVRDALVAEGLVVPAQTDSYGRVKAWAYGPVEPFPTREDHAAAIAELVAGVRA